MSQLAGTVTGQLIKRGLKSETVSMVLGQTRKLMDSPNWRLRCAGTADTIGYLKENWELVRGYDIAYLTRMLFDPEIEVRNLAGSSLSGLLTLLDSEVVRLFATDFRTKAAAAKLRLQEGNNKTVLHGAVLGLIAAVRAHAIQIFSWVPDVLTYLTKFRNNYDEASKAVRVFLADFWERHKSTWEYEKGKFTEDQQADISEHINPYNYFA